MRPLMTLALWFQERARFQVGQAFSSAYQVLSACTIHEEMRLLINREPLGTSFYKRQRADGISINPL